MSWTKLVMGIVLHAMLAPVVMAKKCIIKWSLVESEFDLIGNVDSGGITGQIRAEKFSMRGQIFSSFDGINCAASEFKDAIESSQKLEFIDSGIVSNIPQLRFPRKVRAKIITTNTGIPVNVAHVNLIGGECSLSSVKALTLKYKSRYKRYETLASKYVKVTTKRTAVEILPLIGSRYDGNLNGQATDKSHIHASLDLQSDSEITLEMHEFTLDITSTIQLKGFAILKAFTFGNCTQKCQLHGICHANNCTCECGWSGSQCNTPPKVSYRSVDYILPNRIPTSGGSAVTAIFSSQKNSGIQAHDMVKTSLPTSTFENNQMNGWSCGSVTMCGDYGKICGGYGQKGKSADITKRFHGLKVGETYIIEMDFIRIDSWDNEWAYLTFDDTTCWSRQFLHSGQNQCGNSRWGDSIEKIRCSGKAVKDYVDIRIFANMDEGLTNEAFGIDNVKFASHTYIQQVIADHFGVIVIGYDICNNTTVISDNALECVAPRSSLDKPNFVANVYRAATKDIHCHLPHLDEGDQNHMSKIFYYDSEEVKNTCGVCNDGKRPILSSTTETVIASDNLNELSHCFVDHCKKENTLGLSERDIDKTCTCRCMPGWSGYDCGKCLQRQHNTSNASSSRSNFFGCDKLSNLQRHGNTSDHSNAENRDVSYVCDTNIAYEPDSDVTFYCNPNHELKTLTGHFDVKMSCGVSGVGECSLNVWVPTPRGAFRFLGCQVYGCSVKSVTSASVENKIKQTITCQKAKCSCAKNAPCTAYIKEILRSVTGPFDFACTASTKILGNHDVARCEVDEDHLPLTILLDCNAGVCRDKIIQYQDVVPQRAIDVRLIVLILSIALASWAAILIFFPKLKTFLCKLCKRKSRITPNNSSEAIQHNNLARNTDKFISKTQGRTNTDFSLPNVVSSCKTEVDDILDKKFAGILVSCQERAQNNTIQNKRYMYFEDVTYTIQQNLEGSKKKVEILKGVTGFLECGKLIGVLGPSGAGKTSLLKILGSVAGRSSLPQGAKGTFIGFPRKCLYVPQDSIVMNCLTVEEQIYFSAMLRQPKHVSHENKIKTVDSVISELKLNHVRKSYGKVLSGGEKRRLSICLELAAIELSNSGNLNGNDFPTRLFILDEPLSGLDSIVALHLIKCLSRIAKVHKLSVILSIHQPSQEMFNLLDSAMLIHAGKMAYYGPTDGALKHLPGLFSKSYITGKCDADILLQHGEEIIECTNGEGILVYSNSISVYKAKALKRDQNVSFRKQRKVAATFTKQLWYLSWRSTLNITREPELLRYHLTISLCSALFLGTVFFSVTDDLAGFQNRAGAIFFVLLCFSFSSLSAIEVFIKERHILTQELQNHYYVRSAYFIVQIGSDVLLLRLLPSLLFAMVFILMMGLRQKLQNMLVFTLILIQVNCICGCFSMILAIIHRNVAAATITSNLFVLLSCLFGGLVVNTGATPTFLSWMRSISYFYYSFQGLLANEVNGMELRFNPGGGSGGLKVKGETYMEVLGLKPNLEHDLEMLAWLNASVMMLTAITLYLFVPYNLLDHYSRLVMQRLARLFCRA